MPIGSFLQFFSSAKVAHSNPVSISVTNPKQPQSQVQNQQKNVNDEQPLRITLKNSTSVLPPPPQSPPADHPHPHSQSREDAEDHGQVQPRVRLRSIFSSLSSASPSSAPTLHPDPIRIAFQPADHDQAVKADSTTTPAAVTSAPFQPSAELTISSFSRALSTTLSKSFNRTQVPNKKWLVSKNPTGTIEDGNDHHHHHHHNATSALPVKKQKMKKKKKSISNQLGVVPTTGDHAMKKQLTSTSFLNVIGKKQLTKTLSSHISHQANSLTKSRSYSIVQLDRTNFLSVPKILTSASVGQQLGLETTSVQSAAPPLQPLPDPPTNSDAHYHQDNPSLATLLVSPPLLPLPDPPKPSLYSNHHLQSDGHEHVSFKGMSLPLTGIFCGFSLSFFFISLSHSPLSFPSLSLSSPPPFFAYFSLHQILFLLFQLTRGRGTLQHFCLGIRCMYARAKIHLGHSLSSVHKHIYLRGPCVTSGDGLGPLGGIS